MRRVLFWFGNASCRNRTLSEPLPHKAAPAERSFWDICRDTACRVRQFSQQRERKLASPEREGGRRSQSEGSYCKIEVLEPLRHFVTPPISGEACLLKRFVGTRRAVSDVFAAKKKSLKTFHRNVSKIKKQQPAHRAERSCSLRPRKASLFSPTFPVRQKHGAEYFAVCGRRLRGLLAL